MLTTKYQNVDLSSEEIKSKVKSGEFIKKKRQKRKLEIIKIQIIYGQNSVLLMRITLKHPEKFLDGLFAMDVLQLYARIVRKMERAKVPTLQNIIPVYYGIQKACICHISDNDIIKSFKKKNCLWYGF